ncbi:DedA family protein [Desulfurobacterium atlanticum]|uniref:Membrane-associated protein n=1 Tax=Desulfurobacterium atlanticum TaxID=240169 RepID=A0A238YPK5_9BACT|nr:DedA family protein [Desulfurobacterium atlanticum]SNR72631.1 membrane-associated protein [Desulfurobacterium atlanticum]
MDISGIINESLRYIEANPEVAGLIIGLWAFLETALFFGLIIPAEKVLILGSILAAKGYISPLNFVFSVSLGTFLGYTVSYLFGFYLGEPAVRKFLSSLKLNGENYERVKRFVIEKGEITLLFGRFIAVVRSLLPVIIGAFKMPFLPFLLWNFIGAVLWAVFYLFLGGLIGKIISIIITHKFLGAVVAAGIVFIYYLWRRYGKDKISIWKA